MKYLSITPMYFHETNSQVGQIKMPMHYKINETKLHNQSKHEYRSKDLASCIKIKGKHSRHIDKKDNDSSDSDFNATSKDQVFTLTVVKTK